MSRKAGCPHIEASLWDAREMPTRAASPDGRLISPAASSPSPFRLRALRLYFEAITPWRQRLTLDRYETHCDPIVLTGSQSVSAAFPSVRFPRQRRERRSTAEWETTIS